MSHHDTHVFVRPKWEELPLELITSCAAELPSNASKAEADVLRTTLLSERQQRSFYYLHSWVESEIFPTDVSIPEDERLRECVGRVTRHFVHAYH